MGRAEIGEIEEEEEEEEIVVEQAVVEQAVVEEEQVDIHSPGTPHRRQATDVQGTFTRAQIFGKLDFIQEKNVNNELTDESKSEINTRLGEIYTDIIYKQYPRSEVTIFLIDAIERRESSLQNHIDDLKQMKTKTRHILGVAGEENSSGDPSPVTAWGVYNGMKACANAAFGSRSLKGKTIALQGLGSVNYYLAKHLDEEGAKLIGSDIDKGAAARAEKEFGMQIVDVNGIYDVDCDVFSPGALGAIINETTIPKLRCKIVAGAANNQLATTAAGDALFERGILYAPDYAINAGGLINIFHEREGYSHDRAWSHVAGIYDTVGDILARSVKDKTPEYIVADKISQERIDEAEEKLGRKP